MSSSEESTRASSSEPRTRDSAPGSDSLKRQMEESPPRNSKRITVDRQEKADDRLHVRALLESSVCSRVLGHGGKRLQSLRKRAGTADDDVEAWISKDNSHDYRVLHVVGHTDTVSKFFGLLVRVIYEEPDDPSGALSRQYDLKLLMPHPIMGRLIGSRMASFKDIERKSAAQLSADHQKLPHSDDRVVHVAGVADAVHIATYYLSVIYNEALPLMKQNRLRQYIPGPDKLELKRNDGLERGDRVERERPSVDEERPPRPERQRNGNHADTKEREPRERIPDRPGLRLPDFHGSLPPQLVTAYETAKESKRTTLRQLVRLPKKSGLNELLVNISRVTACAVSTDDGAGDVDVVEIEGPPEDNMLALFLIYRFVRDKTSV